MSNDELYVFFTSMYDEFGQFAVIDFVKSRQENGQLQHIEWHDCNGCDWHTPYLDTYCLVCGGR